MRHRAVLVFALMAVIFSLGPWNQPTSACAPVSRSGQLVVNADQTVILLWDAATQTEHFIRKASFRSDGDDFGFLVPTPKQPELEESGNEAFGFLAKLTEPEVQKVPRPSGMQCGCSAEPGALKSTKAAAPAVSVKAEKEVAGFHAVVLQATSAKVLVQWLKEHGYAYSPEVEAWAKPYVDMGWMITAMKVAAGKAKPDQKVNAAALRLSFQTPRPLFPYREPDSRKSADALKAPSRTLRIYFVAEARYQGELSPEIPWRAKVAWSDKLNAQDRQRALKLLKLPENTGPATWWLTEFEAFWPYELAPGDLYFAQDDNQGTIKRPPVTQYASAPFPTDVTVCALAAILALPLLRRVAAKRP